MIVAAWVVVIVIALVIFGPMLLEMWRTPGEKAPKPVPFIGSRGELHVALAIGAVALVIIALHYLGVL